MNRLVLLLIVGVLISCKSKLKQKEEVLENGPVKLSGELIVSGAYALSPMMQEWANEFMKLHPNLKIKVIACGTSKGMSDLYSGQAGIAMISRKPEPTEADSNLWFASVTKEGVLPVVSSANSKINVLMEKGITKEKLVEVYTKDDLKWSEIVKGMDQTPVKVFRRPETSGAAYSWGCFLKTLPGKLRGTVLETDSDIITTVRNEPNSIAFCNAHYAYKLGGEMQQEGIKVLPIDINNNGIIDKKEMFYLKLCQVQRAGYLGIFPHELCREISIACKEKPTDALRKEFIKWILTTGQEIAVKKGYSKIRDCDAEEILKQL
jgi:phosphate transport system substrate-binding protein